jgi:hypothetical protein
MEPEALTDDELLSLPNGHPMLGKLTSEEASRRTTLQLGTPPGDARTRQDSNIIGLDRDRMSLNIANWASKLSPEWQRPAAMLASFPADAIASLVEMFSSPESVATVGAKPTLAALDAVGTGANVAKNTAIRGAAAVGDVVDPTLLGAVSPKWANRLSLAQRLRDRLNAQTNAPATGTPRLAGKAPTVEGALIDAMNEVRAGAPPQSVSLPGGGAVRATDPVPAVPPPTSPRMGAYSSDVRPAAPAAPSAAPPASAAPGSAQSTPARTPRTTEAGAIRLTSEESQALRALVAEGRDEADVVRAILEHRQSSAPVAAPKPAAPASAAKPATSGKPSLSAAETKEYQRLLGRGKSPQEAMRLIDEQRAMAERMGLPTSEQTRLSVADRNRTGRWD